ncbi:unnamed protein product [marine sediment metagenome]|uniref:Uncharacterized protein n=1 Tax=marine sediment metagenome TaxID=412755 RepID=X1A8Q9_9ZZZZ
MPKDGFDLTKIKRKIRAVGGYRTPAMRYVYQQWGVRYLAWTKRKFIKNAKGGGDWPALKPATIKARRKGKRKLRGRGNVSQATKAYLSVKILRDTSTLFKALTPGSPGNLFKPIRRGIRVGFGGKAKHSRGGKATISDIASFHQRIYIIVFFKQRPYLHQHFCKRVVC